MEISAIKKLILFIFLSTFSGCREKVIEKYPNDNIKQIYYVKRFSKEIVDGHYKKYFEDGTLEEEGVYHNGKLGGIQRIYFTNGKIAEVRFYEDGKREAYDSVWYENEKLRHVKNFKNDKLDGIITEWYRNGSLKAKHCYKNNKHNGKCIIYDTCGNIIEIYNAKNDSLEGKREKYYANGVKKAESNFKSGNVYGKSINYFPNGKITYSFYMYHCIPCDTIISYDSTGILKQKTVFNLNCDSLISGKASRKIMGNSFRYNVNGKIIKKKSFVLDSDSLQHYWSNGNGKYLARKITLKKKLDFK